MLSTQPNEVLKESSKEHSVIKTLETEVIEIKKVARTLPATPAFIGAAVALIGITFAAAAPSPLFVLYQQQWHFPAWVLTVAFAIYAISLLATLLFAGSISDYIGRRPVIIVALLSEVVSMLLFVFANDISVVILARIIQGAATGAATSTFTAAIVELAPDRFKKMAALIGSSAQIGGLALGAVVTGLAIQFTTIPSLLVFSFLTALFLGSAIYLFFVTETVVRKPGAWAALRPRLFIPAQARREFFGASIVLAATWMLTGLYFGLGPSILREVFHLRDGLTNGFLVAVPPTAGTIASLLSGRFVPRKAIIVGTAGALLGAGITTLAVLVAWFPLLVVGAIFSGAGFGGAFAGILRTLGPLAIPSRRAELFAGVYLVNYLAYGVPTLIAGIVIGFAGLLATVTGYGIIVMLMAAGGLYIQVRLAGRAANA